MTILVFSKQGIVGDRKIMQNGMVVDMMDKITTCTYTFSRRKPLYAYLAGIGVNTAITKATFEFVTFLNAMVEILHSDLPKDIEPSEMLSRLQYRIVNDFRHQITDNAELNVVLRHGDEMMVLTLTHDGVVEQRLLPFITGHESAVQYARGALDMAGYYDIGEKSAIVRAVELATKVYFPAAVTVERGCDEPVVQKVWFDLEDAAITNTTQVEDEK